MQYLIKGMTKLAIEYHDIPPHFIVGGGRTDIWVIDDHNLIARGRAVDGSHEEWCKLFKECDCWWLTRVNQENREMNSILPAEQMNTIDRALAGYLAERELLSDQTS